MILALLKMDNATLKYYIKMFQMVESSAPKPSPYNNVVENVEILIPIFLYGKALSESKFTLP